MSQLAATKPTLNGTLGHALTELEGVATYLSQIEERILGPRPQNAEKVPPPSGSAMEFATRLSSLAASLNVRVSNLNSDL